MFLLNYHFTAACNRSFSYYDRHETQLLVLHFDFFFKFLCKCSYKTYKFEQSYSQMQSTAVLPYSIVKYFVIVIVRKDYMLQLDKCCLYDL